MAGRSKLANELLAGDGPLAAGVGGQVMDRIASRERRRLRWCLIATVVLWLIVVVYLFSLLGAYLVFIHPVLHELLTNPEFRQEDFSEHAYALITGLKALLLWPALLLLAAGATISLAVISRRATLRQIQISLAEISEQLRPRTNASEPD